jgi:hypothetical protein
MANGWFRSTPKLSPPDADNLRYRRQRELHGLPRQAVQLKPGANSVALDLHNATPVN